jgi:hypothetical protein
MDRVDRMATAPEAGLPDPMGLSAADFSVSVPGVAVLQRQVFHG